MKHGLLRLIFGLRCLLSIVTIIVCALVLSLVGLFTLFRFRRFYSEKIVAPLGRFILFIWGIHLRQHGNINPIAGQKIYISNHSSTIDIFVLVALGLPNTRFFLSAYLKKILPIGIIGTVMGTFWIVTQKKPAERIEIFKQAERTLRDTKESVYLSPEGKRVVTGKIGAFNKGSFHLASLIKAPIVPFFIHIPREMDPGSGYNAGKGTVNVYFAEPIDTNDWAFEDLMINKEHVRDFYVAWHKDLYKDGHDE